MAVVKEGPDVATFTNPGALTKLALWVGGAVAEKEENGDVDGEGGKRGAGGVTPLVLACVDEVRGVYVVVGLGGGSTGFESIERETARKEKKEKREAKEKAREEKREAKRRECEARDEDDEDDETEEESDASVSSSEEEEEDESPSKKRNAGRNRFGNAFQEVVEETNARVRLDSFEHCVVEVKKEDLSGFLEALSMRAVVG